MQIMRSRRCKDYIYNFVHLLIVSVCSFLLSIKNNLTAKILYYSENTIKICEKLIKKYKQSMLNSLQGRDMHKSVANDDQPERLYKA